MFSLAILVLGSIYNEFNKMVCSSKFGANASIFPIHYLYGWLNEDFDIHFISQSIKPLPIDDSFARDFFAKC